MKYIRPVSLALCLALLLPLSACQSNQRGDEDCTAETTASTTATVTVTEPSTESDTEPSDNNTDIVTEPSDNNTDIVTEPSSESVTEPENPPETDMEDIVNILSSNIFEANTPITGIAGFTNPSAVGIIESEMSTVRYPAPDDGECAKVFRAADYGITPESTDNSSAMAALTAELAETEGLKKVVFPAGVYRFSDTLTFRGISDLYVCGETEDTPYTFLMTEWKPGVQISNCENIHFNGYRFDYEHPSAITGSVASCDTRAGTVTILVDEPYDLTYAGYNNGKINYGSYMEFTYDEAFGVYLPDHNGNLCYNSTGDGIRSIKDGRYDPATRRLTLTFSSIKNVKEGTRVNIAYTMYEHFGFYASDSKDLYMEGVHLYHTAGMAVGADDVDNIYINRMHITPPEGSGRLMTATADCLHFGSCTGEIKVTGSYFSHSHDDAMNIKGAYVKVRYNLPYEIAYDHSTGQINAQVGDTLDAYELTTFRYLGSFTVTGVDSVRHTYTVAERVNMELAGALLCNASASPSLTVENCFIGDKRNRGMLIQCREVTVRNCTFRNILHGAIQILSVADVFAEGIMPRNITVANNKFLNNTSTDVNIFTWGPKGATSGTITGVQINHNFFSGSQSYAVEMLGVGQSSVGGNLFHDVNGGQAVYIRISEGISITDNYGYFTTNVRRSIYKVDASCKSVALSGNITDAKAGSVNEPTQEAEPLTPPTPPEAKPFIPSSNALKAGFAYDWSPDGVTMDLADSGFEVAEINKTAIPASLKAAMTAENGFSTHTLQAKGNGNYVFTGLTASVSRDYFKAGTVYYLTLPIATESAATAEVTALTASGSRTVTTLTLSAGTQTVSIAYRVADGDTGIALSITDGATVYLGNLSIELTDGGPTLALLQSESGFTWDIATVAFENSSTTRVGNLPAAAREALLAAGYADSDPVCVVKDGILQDFFKPEFFVPGTTYELTFKTYAAATHGYLIAMDSTPGNFAQTGNDFIGAGYCERTVTYTVGANGDYALTFYNIPETYLVGMTFRIVG